MIREGGVSFFLVRGRDMVEEVLWLICDRVSCYNAILCRLLIVKLKHGHR